MIKIDIMTNQFFDIKLIFIHIPYIHHIYLLIHMKKFKEKYLENFGDSVELRVYPLYTDYPSGYKYDMPIVVQVLGGKLPNKYITPTNTCIVLDRSGSMSGSPIKNAKKAIQNYVSKMRDVDTVHLVVYESKIDTIFENKTKKDVDDMVSTIQKIGADGCTDLHGGIKRGIEILQSSKAMGQKLLLLFSDGHANKGEIQDGEKIGIATKKMCDKQSDDDPIIISTYGIGNGYNSTLMNSIAVAGSGHHYYINKPESISELIDIGKSDIMNFWSDDAVVTVKGLRKTQVVSMNNCTNLLLGRRLKIREHKVTQYLVEAYNMSNIEPGLVEITLKYVDGHNKKFHIIRKICGWNMLDDVDQFEDDPHPFTLCYQTILECADINMKASDMMKSKEDAKEVIKLKEDIINKYLDVVDLDKFYIIPALLEREVKTLNTFKDKGVYNDESIKRHDYTTTLGATGCCGPLGPQGPRGSRGVAGVYDYTGLIGSTGPTGPSIPTGPTGPSVILDEDVGLNLFCEND